MKKSSLIYSVRNKRLIGKWVESGPIKGFKHISDSRKVKMVRRAIEATNKYRPFSKNGKGDQKKDYYRGQWDALVYVLEDLLGEEL